MRYIPLLTVGNVKAQEVIESVLRFGGERGIPLDQMRRRNRIWDALDKNADLGGLLLEDSDADLLISLVKSFPFAVATRELLQVCDAILEAKAPAEPKAKTNGADHRPEQPAA